MLAPITAGEDDQNRPARLLCEGERLGVVVEPPGLGVSDRTSGREEQCQGWGPGAPGTE